MELMDTCLDKLMKRLKAPIPEDILGKVAVAVSFTCFKLCSIFFVIFTNDDGPFCVLRFFAQTVEALNYLKEKHGVIHRGKNMHSLISNMFCNFYMNIVFKKM